MPGTLSIRFDGANYFVLDTTSSGTTTYGPYSTRADAEAQLALLSPAASVEPDVDVDGSTATGFVEFDELAGNPLTPADNVLRLFAKDNSGVTALYTRIYGGNVKRLLTEDDAGFQVPSGATFSLAANGGHTQGKTASGGVLTASGIGSFAGGYPTGASTAITATNRGSRAFGYGYGAGAITASGMGAHAWGYVGGSGSTLVATSTGATAFGKATNGGDIRSIHHGTLAFGTAYGGVIEAGYGSRKGCAAFGYARQFAGTGRIRASRYGALAAGYAAAFTGATSATITASGYGSIAFGSVAASSGQTTQIRASGTGAFAMGYAMNTNGSDINASALGSMAHGGAIGVALTASGKGSHAFGYAKTNAITASGVGSAAFGYSSTAAVVASATNAFQFGPGTNSVANSLQIGAAAAGIHLHGGGAPGAPANGDIWNTGTLVVIRSDGVNITLDQGAAVADAAGGATVDAEARTAINALLARLRTTNLIAT